ncbi:glycosyltransferase family 4 protein [Chryseobacterium joostei]|uniref:glycosyltransferase family 4 protein n=1 Tax=Chryseobacterium joostei TaxID=112234 RepID=UPI0023F0C24F|nr:glycosyltransferase family 4 protein [Chryseobacterium joostei]
MLKAITMSRVALIGNYPPRKCGISTFMYDLNMGLKDNGVETSIVAMNDGFHKYDYPNEVILEIEQNDLASYVNAANFLNLNSFDAVILQHEFGIFGGQDGRHILQLLKRLRMPIITTLHTILDAPTDGQRDVILELARLSKKIVSISQKGIEILSEIYQIPSSLCEHIHHGVHQFESHDLSGLRSKLGLTDKRVLMTFGLLSKNKSIEVVIRALPQIVKKFPDVLYVVLGATHPHVVKHEGEEYRHSLMRLVNKLGLQRHVIFIDRYVSNQELFEFLEICDIYIIPYSGEKQISSGTLIYAMNAGKPIVSTPFWYAKEMLAEERGLLFDFGDSKQMALKVISLLGNEEERTAISENAKAMAEDCWWPNIGRHYQLLVDELIQQDKEADVRYQLNEDRESEFSFPPLNLQQLRILTDLTGILQHARYTIPDRTHGYCLDDNARALVLCVMLQNDMQDIEELTRLTSIYLSFIDYSFHNKSKRFRNFMSYERSWLEDEGSEDSAGRAIWALGYTASYTKVTNFCYHANDLFEKVLEDVGYIQHPRALSYMILGLTSHVNVYREPFVEKLLKDKAGQLFSFFDQTIDDDWLWYENVVTYANSRIPQALLAAGMALSNYEMMERGLKILDWLIQKQFSGDVFSPIGNNGWLTKQGKARYDQQPLEAHGMIDACLEAEKQVKDGRYAHYAAKAFEWFTGNNDISLSLYDFATGGCRDGLHRDGLNHNQGAESTLSWLMSLVTMSYYLRNKNKRSLSYDNH